MGLLLILTEIKEMLKIWKILGLRRVHDKVKAGEKVKFKGKNRSIVQCIVITLGNTLGE